jgi:hypothetical protein
MQIFETCQHERLIPSRSHKTKCIVYQSNNIMLANGRPTAFQFDTFLTTLQNAIGQGGKLDVRLAKRFVWEKLSKKVQFLQPNNDDMMKKVYVMAQKYMNYDANEFSSVWTKVVLPTIKSEMKLLRSRYAAAIKNRVICGEVLRIVGCTSACNCLTSQLLACPILYV